MSGSPEKHLCEDCQVLADRDRLRAHGRYTAGWQAAAARALDAAARTSISSAELATLREALTPGGGS